MKGPFLPLYGSGAIMILVVSKPFCDNIPLAFLAGCVGTTVLEYCTGIAMEELFNLRYWDYSHEKFNFQGRICLKSTLTWGGLTLLMNIAVHRNVEKLVFMIPTQVLSIITLFLTAGICADFALSFRTALDLRDVLVKLENAKIELGHLQMKLDFMIALTTDEWEQKIQEYKNSIRLKREAKQEAAEERTDEILQTISDTAQELGENADNMESGSMREKIRMKISIAQKELLRRRTDIMSGMASRLREMFMAYPTIHSDAHEETLEELQEYVTKSPKGSRRDSN